MNIFFWLPRKGKPFVEVPHFDQGDWSSWETAHQPNTSEVQHRYLAMWRNVGMAFDSNVAPKKHPATNWWLVPASWRLLKLDPRSPVWVPNMMKFHSNVIIWWNPLKPYKSWWFSYCSIRWTKQSVYLEALTINKSGSNVVQRRMYIPNTSP